MPDLKNAPEKKLGKKSGFKGTTGVRVFGLALAFLGLGVFVYFLSHAADPQGGSWSTPREIKVLTYSAFSNALGPGPEIAKLFDQEFGVKVIFQDAGDAGLLLQKLTLFPSDVVMGLDQFSKIHATDRFKWRRWGQDPEFTAFDKAALTFVYREGELKPPTTLEDLLDKRFNETVVLEDPGSSSPGLQFFFWVLDSQGIDNGFAYLSNLKSSIRAISPSWSSAYGLFTKKQAKLAFSYITSPVYHWVEEKNSNYEPAIFTEGMPVQVEYAGVPQICENCESAHQFIQFLLRPDIQKIIMNKNYMLPVVADIVKGSAFEKLPDFKEYEWKNLPYLIEHRDELLNRWRGLNL